MLIAEHIKFPAQCPACEQTHGKPYLAATTLHGSIRVGVRCGVCQHAWEIDMPSAALPAGVTHDRRGTSRNAG